MFLCVYIINNDDGCVEKNIFIINIDVYLKQVYSITSKFEALHVFIEKPVVSRRLSLIQYLIIYLACISLVYALWELLSGCTEYLEPSCFCFSPLLNLKLCKLELRDSYILPSRYTINDGW